jgi:hypothetical protein
MQNTSHRSPKSGGRFVVALLVSTGTFFRRVNAARKPEKRNTLPLLACPLLRGDTQRYGDSMASQGPFEELAHLMFVL